MFIKKYCCHIYFIFFCFQYKLLIKNIVKYCQVLAIKIENNDTLFKKSQHILKIIPRTKLYEVQ